jgi:hypothetical protein
MSQLSAIQHGPSAGRFHLPFQSSTYGALTEPLPPIVDARHQADMATAAEPSELLRPLWRTPDASHFIVTRDVRVGGGTFTNRPVTDLGSVTAQIPSWSKQGLDCFFSCCHRPAYWSHLMIGV